MRKDTSKSQATLVAKLVQALEAAQLDYADIDFYGEIVPAGYGFREWLREAGVSETDNYPGSARCIATELVNLGAVVKLSGPAGKGAKNHFYLAVPAAEAATMHYELRIEAYKTSHVITTDGRTFDDYRSELDFESNRRNDGPVQLEDLMREL